MRIRHSNQTSGAVVGGVLVVFGTVLLLDRLHFIEIRDFFRFWPALLIAFGVLRMIQGPDGGARVFGGLVSMAGVVLLANRLGFTNIRLFDLWPMVIVGVGVVLLWNALEGRASGTPAPPPGNSENWLQFSTVFGGIEVRSNSQAFEGGNLTAIFGGCEVDLSRTIMATDSAVLNMSAIFGGISIRVPETWTVVFQGTPVFGGYEDKTRHPVSVPGEPVKTLYVRGTAAFGGIEVKN